MADNTTLYFGSLLHDIGKVVMRGSSGNGTHSELGADFIKDEIAPLNSAFDGETGQLILDQINFHHGKELAGSRSLPNDSLAYITYFANNISTGMDRREIEVDESNQKPFDLHANLKKVFNNLNGHADDNEIPHDDYNAIREQIKNNLVKLNVSLSGANSLLNVLEVTTSSMPSSIVSSEVTDISLYDHARTTAALAACIHECLIENQVSNFQQALFESQRSQAFYEEEVFLLYSFDVSGIQSFIYNISGAGALKQLRARSLYLELLIEHIADELLVRLGLCRANLLYLGGGHSYFILPNTKMIKATLQEFEQELKLWLIQNFNVDLYVASAWTECSANDLMNKGPDQHRYANLFQTLSRKLSDVKSSRYTADDIRGLNAGVYERKESEDHSRECIECQRSDVDLDGDGRCGLCSSLGAISNDLVDKDLFVIVEMPQEEQAFSDKRKILPLPFNRALQLYARDEYLSEKPQVMRIYTKNSSDVGDMLATHIWMGDYTFEVEDRSIRFESYSSDGETLPGAKGIKRLGVLRADVDDLGVTFVAGLPLQLHTISRTATLSRALSMFFKNKINQVLENANYHVQIIYSGGDDVFIIGNWFDVIYASVDLRRALLEFTGNDSLTISAGIGIFDEKYPIARMASETGYLEDAAKHYVSSDGKTKDALTLWSEKTVFSWGDFTNGVLPLLYEVQAAFEQKEKGKAFVYNLISLLRSYDEVISAPRLAYLLARSFEADKPAGEEYCKRFYELAKDEKERVHLIAALELYVYSTRER